MARFTTSGRTTIAGSATLPCVSLYSVAGCRPRVAEVGLFNTSLTACCSGLIRLTSTGTQGAGLTEVSESDTAQAALATGFAGHTVAPTLGGEVRRADLGAAVGSGIIWTFGPLGLVIPNTTGDGIGVYVPVGTGQVLDYYIVWDE